MRPPAPQVPHLLFHIVDVRDVAAAHVKALTTPGAANQRYICSAVEESVPFTVISATLHDEFAPLGYVFQLVSRILFQVAHPLLTLASSSGYM